MDGYASIRYVQSMRDKDTLYKQLRSTTYSPTKATRICFGIAVTGRAYASHVTAPRQSERAEVGAGRQKNNAPMLYRIKAAG